MSTEETPIEDPRDPGEARMPTEETPGEAPETAADDAAETSEPQMITGRDRGKRLLRAGVFAAIGLILLLVGVFVIGGKQNLFSTTIPVFTTFQTVEGLKSGAPVMMSGIKVGTVSNVLLQLDTGTSVRVDMVLDGEYEEFLRTSTYATIGQAGLIGDKLIELRVRDAAAPKLEPNSRIESIPPPNYTAIIDEARLSVKNAERITGSLDTLFMRFRRGEGTLGKLLTDEEAYRSMLRLSLSAEQLFDRTNQQIAAVGGSVDKAALNIEQMTAASRDLMVDVSRGKGTIGALMYDRTLYDSLESLTGTLTEAASSAGFAAREFGLNMRGLRNNWLVGGLFGGGEEAENVELLSKQLQIREEELRRQRQLLEQREKQILDKERTPEIGAAER
jgi:phospholipid/cholesterol/gamma-HCH transport system substrate-binding protein